MEGEGEGEVKGEGEWEGYIYMRIYLSPLSQLINKCAGLYSKLIKLRTNSTKLMNSCSVVRHIYTN